MAAPASIAHYLRGFDDERRSRLEAVLAVVREELPDAEEAIRYGMPAISLGGRHWIHVGGWKQHLGIYPVYRLDHPLEAELAPYRAATDAVQFRWGDELPLALIRRIVAHLAAH